MQTGNTYSITALRNQTIRPYSDVLLHDMGDELSNNAADFLATGNEWRTQPLWGIGLINTVNGHTNLLHDGRALEHYRSNFVAQWRSAKFKS